MRVFELACYAYLEAAGLDIDRSFAAPDFVARKGAEAIAIEVATANPTDGASRDVLVAQLSALTDAEVLAKSSIEFPRRVLRTLTNKVRRRYGDHPHIAGKPLVIMVAPFHEAGSSFYVEDALLPALFPLEPDDPPEAPFFARPEAAAISAVAYCNAFSVSKFWRMADPAFIAEHFIAEREGDGLFEGKDGLHHFRYRVGHPVTPIETWHEGVSLILNPHAEILLPEGVLPASGTTFVDGDHLDKRIRGFHPLASTMIVHRRRAKTEE